MRHSALWRPAQCPCRRTGRGRCSAGLTKRVVDGLLPGHPTRADCSSMLAGRILDAVQEETTGMRISFEIPELVLHQLLDPVPMPPLARIRYDMPMPAPIADIA